MFRLQFTIAVRNILKYKFFSLINITGLGLGFCCCILSVLYIKDELSFDKYNNDYNQIYRVVVDIKGENGDVTPQAVTPAKLGNILKNRFQGIEGVTRFFPKTGLGSRFLVKNGSIQILVDDLCHVDDNFFQIFSIPLISGNNKTSLADPNSIVLTKTLARKMFGSADPIGRTLTIDDWDPLTVTAIVEDLPGNSHFKFEALVPMKRFMDPQSESRWTNRSRSAPLLAIPCYGQLY